MTSSAGQDERDAIESGRASLGIELGSTRIKACLIDEGGHTLASGSHAWENQLVDGLWSYDLADVRAGVRAAYAELAADVRERHDVEIRDIAAVGVSAMMHGYLAFDEAGELLVPFRTWRNVNTAVAADRLTNALAWNMPLRWSAAHLLQAAIDREDHVSRVAHITTLAGYVHELLTGERVLGVGDASGMFPVDPQTRTYDVRCAEIVDGLLAGEQAAHLRIRDVLPVVRSAGDEAGRLTEAGAAMLDEAGALRAGAVAAPPEGDAGTGMVATNAIAPRTGNVSAGTSIFAMVVLERPLTEIHPEIDVVTTPEGALVAMVHCNNGASELAAWASLFGEFARAIGRDMRDDEVFEVLLRDALEPSVDDGLFAYNHLSGEPIAHLEEGRPLVVRTPDSSLTVAGLMRAQVRGVFATLSLGMRALDGEGVEIDSMFAHGGIFRTEQVGQRLLAAALGTDVVVSDTASEGGAWGMALLAAYRRAVADGSAPARDLAGWLDSHIFGGVEAHTVSPTRQEIDDHETYLAAWSAGLEAERAAGRSIHPLTTKATR